MRPDTQLLFSHSVVSNSLRPHELHPLSWSLLKLVSVELVMPSNHLVLCRPLLLPSIFPNIMVFSNKSALHIRWPKYWSCSFSISPSSEYSGLISFRIDWLDLLAVQGWNKMGMWIWCAVFLEASLYGFHSQLEHQHSGRAENPRRGFVPRGADISLQGAVLCTPRHRPGAGLGPPNVMPLPTPCPTCPSASPVPWAWSLLREPRLWRQTWGPCPLGSACLTELNLAMR